jgi:hypothetical protein
VDTKTLANGGTVRSIQALKVASISIKSHQAFLTETTICQKVTAARTMANLVRALPDEGPELQLELECLFNMPLMKIQRKESIVILLRNQILNSLVDCEDE